MRVSKLLSLHALTALLLLLGACGDTSGIDPSSRLSVPPSFSTYLPASAIRPYSQIVANVLREQNLPGVADYTGWHDWQLRLSISRGGNMATPVFVLIDPSGSEMGTVRARAVPMDTWRRAQPETLRLAASDAAPRIAAIFNRVVAERRQLAERAARDREAAEQLAREREAAERRRLAQIAARSRPPTKIVISAITGAPTDGNRVLAQLMRDKLTKLGDVVQDGGGADFTLRAKIDDIAVDAKTRRLEIYWFLVNAQNQEVGEIVQLEEVAVGALDAGWGKLAASVTEEASGAVHDIILTQLGLR